MEDLQTLLEKINREGVEKAEAKKREIVDAAQKDASAIVQAAHDEAKRIVAVAQRESAAYADRATESLRQAARDVVIGVKKSIEGILDRLLAKSVNAALADEKVATELVASAIRELAGPGEVACGAKLAEALRARLAEQKAFTVVTDDSLGGGFAVKNEGGRVEHAFTEEAIASELARHLRPDLAALFD